MSRFYTYVRQWGNDILVTGYDNGQPFRERIKHNPTLYIPVSKDTNYKTLEGRSLAPKTFETIKSARSFMDRYRDVSNYQLYGYASFATEYISELYSGSDIKYDFDLLRIYYIDIETYSGNGFCEAADASEAITAITFFDSKTKKYYVFSYEGYTPNRQDVVHFEYKRESGLLQGFVDYWSKNYPDIVTGWNSTPFDMTYIVNRLIRVFGEHYSKRLSPWGIVTSKVIKQKRFGKDVETPTYEIAGINLLDYLDLYKKYVPNQEASYKLGYISNKVLGEDKLHFDGSLHELYMTDYQKYIEYNVQDVALLPQLEDKLGFIKLIVDVAYLGKVPTYMDAGGSVKWWEICIYNHLKEKGVYIPLKSYGEGGDIEKYEGAYVYDPEPGMYEWAVTFDVTSLYPSIIRSLNIGPETLVRPEDLTEELIDLSTRVNRNNLIERTIDTSILKKYNYSLSANGKFYRRDKQSFLSELMEKFFNLRVDFRQEASKAYKAGDMVLYKIYDIRQQAFKIILNSAYGCVGQQFFQFFSVDNAEAITITGQVINRGIEMWLNKYISELLGGDYKSRAFGGDTDSTFWCFNDFVTRYMSAENDNYKIARFLDKLCQTKIEPKIEEIIQETNDQLNFYSNNIHMSREVIATKAVITGKKRYFMNVLVEDEKYLSEPKLKIKGIEVVSSNMPTACRDYLMGAIKIIINEDEDALIRYIRGVREDFYSKDAESVCEAISVNGLYKYVTASGRLDKTQTIPYNTRAAYNYNTMLTKLNMGKEKTHIKDGDKIKLLYLTMPNPLGDNVVAFPDKLPDEFDLHDYIDYNKELEKFFIDKLKKITDSIGWRMSKRATIDV